MNMLILFENLTFMKNSYIENDRNQYWFLNFNKIEIKKGRMKIRDQNIKHNNWILLNNVFICQILESKILAIFLMRILASLNT